MAKPSMKVLSVQVPAAQHEAIRKWAKQRDSDLSKTVRKALREFCLKEGITIDEHKPINSLINNSIDPLAERLANAGIGLDDLGTDEEAP